MLHLKNPAPFAKPSAPTDASNDPFRSLKRWQLEHGRVRKRVEAIAAELDCAQDKYRQADQHLGECLYEEKDINGAEVALTQAAEQIRRLETALKVAEQRMDTAEKELKHAETEAKREASREEQAQLLTTAKQIDQWMESGKPLFEKYAAQQKALLDRGDDDVKLRLQQANLSFKTYLFRVCPKMAGCSTGYEAFQSDHKWSLPWSSHHPGQDIVELNE